MEAEPLAPHGPPISYLRSLRAIRERSKVVFDLIAAGQGDYWDWHPEKLPSVIDYCVDIIHRDFGTNYDAIPPLSRRNQFVTLFSTPVDRIAAMTNHPLFPSPNQPLERARAMVDLYVVLVLLGAGLGQTWTYTEMDEHGRSVWRGHRSEALAVAIWNMFARGVFSAVPSDPFRVDAAALRRLTVPRLNFEFQVSPTNPMPGLEGRTKLVVELGRALAARSDLPNNRPSDIITVLQPRCSRDASGRHTVKFEDLWKSVVELLAPIWPSHTALRNYPGDCLGDVWYCQSLARNLATSGVDRYDGDDLVPFHKLTMWLCYLIKEPLEAEAGITVESGCGQTGLAEYRNGGLLIDLGLLTIRQEAFPNGAYPNGRDRPPVLAPNHPAVVEWRAVTIIALDYIHQGICAKLGVSTTQLGLDKVLAAATWVGGRTIAMTKRPPQGGPPIEIVSDGTVF